MLPNWVRIKRNLTYEKVYQDVIGDPKHPDAKNTHGYCDDETKHLYIKLGLTKLEQQQAEMHELLHAIIFRYKIKISHTQMDRLATALVDVCRLNGWLK